MSRPCPTCGATPAAPIASISAATFAALVRKVARLFCITEEEVLGRGRTVLEADARHVLAWILRNRYRLSYPAIGHLLDRDHKTAMHAVGRVSADVDLLSIAMEVLAMEAAA